MSDCKILSKLRSFIQSNFMVASDFDSDASFLQEGIIDSLGVLDLMSFIEEAFKFKPEANEIVPENFDSLNKLAAFVKLKQGSTD
ncbi:acyl carrier protein [bacterium]|nr:acyl carrier protein [bacterium]